MKKPIVLIIDDLPNDRNRLHKILLKNFECHLATNGYKGLMLFNQLNPDIVLCDVEMPAINGFEVCQKIRLQDNAVKIALVSAHTDPQIRIQGNNSGADDFIEKHWTRELILSQVTHLYQRPAIQEINFPTIEGKTTREKIEDYISSFYTLPPAKRKKTALLLEDICDEIFHKSKSVVQKKIKKDTGKTFTDIHTKIKIRIAIQLLTNEKRSTDYIAEWLNYSQPSHFTQAFKRVTGRTPRQYAREHR